jgi:protein O-GlcNAc transferase
VQEVARPRATRHGPVRARAIVAGIVLAGMGVGLVWIFSADPLSDAPTADILRELRSLETKEEAEQAPEVLAVHQEAVRVARQLLERYPDSHEAIDAVAWTYLRLGRAEEARKCWERCVEMAPGFGDGYFWLGRLARDVGQEERAVELFRQAIAHGTTNRAVGALLARSLENLGRFTEATAILEAEDKSNPNNPAILAFLGQVYLKDKNYGKARTAFESALALEPEVPGVNFGLATVYARLGDQAKAKQATERFEKEKEKNAKVEKEVAEKFSNNLSVAREFLAGACTVAGKVYYAQGDAREAEEYWRRAAEVAPQMFESRVVLAWALQQQGRNNDALAVLTELIETNPDNPDAYLRIGERAVALKRFEMAERAYRGAIRVAPRKAAGYVALAQVYLQNRKNVAEAITLAQQAANLEPSARNYYLLATAFLARGDRTMAMVAIDRAVAQDPDDAHYRELRESIRRGP